TSTLRVSHDQRKRELVNELNIVLKAAASHRRPNKEPLPAELTANVCAVVEAILIHGLRDPFFLRGSRYAKYPEPNFWPFVSKFTHRSVTTQIHALNLIKTEIGKSRAWVRIVLNEGGLEHYLGVLSAEKKALGQFYLEDAFLRDSEQVERTKDMLKSLAGVTISAPTNSSLLNSWTPSPLILAGLVDGKPLRVNQLPIHRRVSSKEDQSEEELGICALELLPSTLEAGGVASPSPSTLPSSSSLRVPLSLSMAGNGTQVAGSPSPQSMLFLRAGLQKPSPRGKYEEGDDNSSIYSHPSMVADCRGGGGGGSGGLRGSAIMETSSDGLVQRRTKRRRNMSRSSSDGSGSGQLRKAAAAAAQSQTEPAAPAADTEGAAATEAVRVKEESLDGETEARRRRRENSGERRDSGVESEANNASLSVCPTISSSNDEPDEKEKKRDEDEEKERKEEEEGQEDPISGDGGEEEAETMFEMSGDAETLKEGEKEEQGIPESPDAVERREENEYVEEYEMASSSSVLPQHQHLEDEGISSLSGNSLMGRSWRHANRYASSIAGSSVAAPDAVDDEMRMMDESFEGGEVAFSPNDQPPTLSTSSDTDSSLPAGVSFGAALRRHVVQQAGGADVLIRKRDFSDSTEDGEEIEDEEITLARKEAEEQETLRKLTEIATESGLDAQEFRCVMCKTTIGMPTYRAYSVCALDARYYCSECWQQGAERVVPSRLITSWDVKMRKVSPRSRVFLDSIGDKPLLHMDKANPSIYQHSPAIKEVKELREKLQLVAMYLFNCRESVAADLRTRLAPKEYFIDDVHLYSYNDLLTVISGSMARQLKIMLKYAIGHVFDCSLCSQKGFHCEMCNEKAVIYPFQTDLTHRCGECYTVSHIACFERTQECVKCERRRKYSATRREATHLEIDC
ncbi:hypothetical protein PENTCL1PPCAC_7438, partial [Pristionchus entomophagus]